MLNGRKLVRDNIITKVKEENIAQHGVDLNLIQVQRIVNGRVGRIPVNGKTILVDYEDVPVIDGIWALKTGMYNIVFEQGCNIPPMAMLLIRQRSSLLRNGIIIHSSVFDAGFKTENIGTMMVVNHPIVIEEGARVAQIYEHQCFAIDEKDLYGAEGKNSQWQNDTQRGK
jgi:dUTP pyrophosphatase